MMNAASLKKNQKIILSTIALFFMVSLAACSDSSSDSSYGSPGGGSGTPAPAPEINSFDPEANDSSVILGSAISVTFD
jgi:hypothetical protein